MSERSCKSCQYQSVCEARRGQGDWIAEMCNTYQHYCDRDALLKLADELEEETGSVCGVCMGKTARRIREALGVSDG